MPELRKDPITHRWVIIASERAKRPHDFKITPEQPSGGFCPFCEGNEDKTPKEIIAYRKRGTERDKPGWSVRVVPNKFPALQIEGTQGKRGEGIYDMMNGIGAHEVIIESPNHVTTFTALTDEHVQEIIWAYKERLVDLKNDPRFRYGLIFKNVGRDAGASLEHSHSQLIVTPIVPITVDRELMGSKKFYEYRGRCVYCDMIEQEIASRTRLVMESEYMVAFSPFAARFPFETWITPKAHAAHFENIQKNWVTDLAYVLKKTLLKLEKALNCPPYNFIIHTTPFDQKDIEHYHWHIEIIPRLTHVAGFEWGSGFYINPVPPENAADFMRQSEV